MIGPTIPGAPISTAIRPDPAGGRLLLTIADHGPGVADADRDSLFERFGRGSADDHPEGTGIGLYVSRELCRAMGGSLELDAAREGAGAEFTIALPAESPAASES